MKTDFDIAVIGSGFGGSLIAMIAKRLGRSVVMIERDRHPRFAIGESSTTSTETGIALPLWEPRQVGAAGVETGAADTEPQGEINLHGLNNGSGRRFLRSARR